MLALVVSVLGADPAPWKKVDTVDDITVEQRPVEGSPTLELRLKTTVGANADRLCDEVFGTGKFDAAEPDLKSRKILEESADERVTYEQISPPLVSNRDFAVRARRVHLDGGVCQMSFEAANDKAPPLPQGWVRIEKLKGLWTFEPLPDGKAKLTYVIHTDPAGAIPPFMIEGTRRKLAIDWVKLIARRATAPRK